SVDEEARTLAERASKRLQAGGSRAFARGDMPGAVNLLRRAAELLPKTDRARLELVPDLATALTEVGELSQADSILGETIEEAQALSWLLIGTWSGPTPVEDGIRRCQEILERSPTRQVEAMALLEQAPLLAMCGRFSEARELFQRGKEIIEDLGLAISAAGASQERFDIEMLAGDPEAAEIELRRACETLERLG